MMVVRKKMVMKIKKMMVVMKMKKVVMIRMMVIKVMVVRMMMAVVMMKMLPCPHPVGPRLQQEPSTTPVVPVCPPQLRPGAAAPLWGPFPSLFPQSRLCSVLCSLQPAQVDPRSQALPRRTGLGLCQDRTKPPLHTPSTHTPSACPPHPSSTLPPISPHGCAQPLQHLLSGQKRSRFPFASRRGCSQLFNVATGKSFHSPGQF